MTQKQWVALLNRGRSAGETWASCSVSERAERLLPLVEAISARSDEIVALICEENGKPSVEALAHEVLPSLANIRYLLGRGPKVLAPKGQFIKWLPFRKAQICQRPFGVVAVISPWNVPLAIPLGQVVAGLLAGNAVVLKPSEFTPRVGALIGELVAACDLPDGLFQVVQGDGKVGAGLIKARPDKVFFTGSLGTGRKVMAAAAKHPIPVSLELGGIDAIIVCKDADLEYAASAAAWGATFNAGQICASLERILVHESVADFFLQLVTDKLKRIDTTQDLGHITMPRQCEVYEQHLADARERDLHFHTGGDLLNPTQMAPTLISGPGTEDSLVFQEETFGPIVAAVTFFDEDQAIAIHNRTGYGLSASVFTTDQDRAHRISQRLRAGLVSVNGVAATLHGHPELPWGGVGDSGYGRSHGEQGLLEMTWSQVIEESRVFGVEPKRPWWYPYDHRQNRLMGYFSDLVAADSLPSKLQAMSHLGRDALAMVTRTPRR